MKIIFIKLILILILSIIAFFLNLNYQSSLIINKDNNITKYIISNKIDEQNNKNITKNKGFLFINTTHHGKFKLYNYSNNIQVYKDLYNNIEYVPISNSNSILNSKQISPEEYSRICEQGILLDKTKYKRNKNTRISVIIPYFNKGFFSMTMLLRSIQNQSFKDIEIIFVDDGSYEGDIKTILDAMRDDNRIILIRHKEKKTTLLTRVDGIRYASGEYIIQIDQDDMYLNNLLFEKLYILAKELNVDIVQFNQFVSENSNKFKYKEINMPKNIIIKQPELKTAFFVKNEDENLGGIKSRYIWDKFVRRATYLEAINDLTDEYMNHKFHYYEDTIMIFELSQIANSYFFYEIPGYRYCIFNSWKTSNMNSTIEKELYVMNQFLFIKLLIKKINPKYDRNYLNNEYIFEKCGRDVEFVNIEDLDLCLEVIEILLELERIYKNTNPRVLDCVKNISKILDIHFTKTQI